METIEIRHHLTQAKVTGFGWKDLVRNYNLVTLNFGNYREILPETVDSVESLKETLKSFYKPAQKGVAEVKSEAPKVASAKKKSTTKKKK